LSLQIELLLNRLQLVRDLTLDMLLLILIFTLELGELLLELIFDDLENDVEMSGMKRNTIVIL
jgi:hypothetical protein